MSEETTVLTLSSGLQVQVVPLRTRQFLKLMKILTHGAGEAVGRISLNDDPTQFAMQLLTVAIVAIPDSENETIEFLQSMVKPVGLRETGTLNKQDREINNTMWAALDAELFNPEIDDTVSIIEAVVKRESEDLQVLGKRLMSMFTVAQKTGQLTPEAPTETPEPAEVEAVATKKSKKAASEE